MKKSFIVIFLFLGMAFLVVTYFKYASDSISSYTSNQVDRDSTRSQIINFWKYYDKATDQRTNGDFSAAAEYYNRALQIDPVHQNSLYYLGNVELATEKYLKAEKHWKQLIEINPASVRGYSQLGILYSCRETGNRLYKLENAAEYFSKAFQLNMENTGTLLQLAKINMVNRQLEEAGRKLNDVLAGNFRSAEACFLKGYLEWKKGERQKSEELLKKTVSIVAGTSSEHENIGEGETKKGSDPILSEERQCSLFSDVIDRLVQKMDPESIQTDYTYLQFHKEVKKVQGD